MKNNEISEIVKIYFKEKGFELINNQHTIPQNEDTVIIPNIQIKLKEFWYRSKERI